MGRLTDDDQLTTGLNAADECTTTRHRELHPARTYPGARFTKYLTICRNIILSSSSDRLTIAT